MEGQELFQTTEGELVRPLLTQQKAGWAAIQAHNKCGEASGHGSCQRSRHTWLMVCSRSSLPPPMPAPRCLPTASISSMKMMHGALALACTAIAAHRQWVQGHAWASIDSVVISAHSALEIRDVETTTPSTRQAGSPRSAASYST